MEWLRPVSNCLNARLIAVILGIGIGGGTQKQAQSGLQENKNYLFQQQN